MVQWVLPAICLYFWRFIIVIIIVKHQFYISPRFDIFWGHFPGCIFNVNRSHACIIPDIIITKLIFLCYLFSFSILHKETLSLLSFFQYHIHICNLHCKFKLIQIYYIILYSLMHNIWNNLSFIGTSVYSNNNSYYYCPLNKWYGTQLLIKYQSSDVILLISRYPIIPSP